MAALRMATHAITGRRIVEVYDNSGALVAAIYPDEALNGIKIVSKYVSQVVENDGERSLPEVPAVQIAFRRP